MTFLSFLVMASLAAACVLAGRGLFHYFQLESYQFPGYFRTLQRNFLRAVWPGALLDLIWVLSAVLLARLIPEDLDWVLCLAESLLLLLAGFLIRRKTMERAEKKPLRYTARMKRLLVVSFLVFLGLLFLFSRGGAHWAGGGFGWKLLFILFALFPLLLPLWIALAGLLAWPMEKGISEMYFRDAQRILKSRPDLIRIGITGSWGKTSVKFILGTLLEEKYHTLVTPASFNTPMGVTSVIRSRLEPGHRVFVAEMGARHVGDIREMCRLVRPQMGLLTSVGPQHLDTFRTVERVARTKYELMDAIPEDGACFFADDDGIVRELWSRTRKPKTLAGLDGDRDDVWAEDLRTTPEGSLFTLCTKDFREECETVLLGELNIRNIVLAASVCVKLGFSPEQISRGIRKLRPVDHRLQLIAHPGGLNVIDDAFNSNIRGAEQAFRVLKEFPPRRIVVTPGMVELGEQEEELNRRMGTLMAPCCDRAILVGRSRAVPIRTGLLEAGLPEEQITVVDSLEEAAGWLREHTGAGDTVLFENDLPDNY